MTYLGRPNLSGSTQVWDGNKFVSTPVNAGGGGDSYWTSSTANVILTTGSVGQTGNTFNEAGSAIGYGSAMFAGGGNSVLGEIYSSFIAGGYNNTISASSDSGGFIEISTILGSRDSSFLASNGAKLSDNAIIASSDTGFTSNNSSGFSANNAVIASYSTLFEGTNNQGNSVISSQDVLVKSGSFLNTALSVGYSGVSIFEDAEACVMIGGNNNRISSSVGEDNLINSVIIGSNWTITSGSTIALGNASAPSRIFVSGTSGIDITGQTKFFSGLSGSLTKLSDGSSYLVAGTNISITTGSTGNVTIASTGGSGDSIFVLTGTLPHAFTSSSVVMALSGNISPQISGSIYKGTAIIAASGLKTAMSTSIFGSSTVRGYDCCRRRLYHQRRGKLGNYSRLQQPNQSFRYSQHFKNA